VYGLIGHLHVQRVAIRIRIHSNRRDAHLARGLDHAAGDFTAVGYQDLVKQIVFSL
jgi:hypothetical protein